MRCKWRGFLPRVLAAGGPRRVRLPVTGSVSVTPGLPLRKGPSACVSPGEPSSRSLASHVSEGSTPSRQPSLPHGRSPPGLCLTAGAASEGAVTPHRSWVTGSTVPDRCAHATGGRRLPYWAGQVEVPSLPAGGARGQPAPGGRGCDGQSRAWAQRPGLRQRSARGACLLAGAMASSRDCSALPGTGSFMSRKEGDPLLIFSGPG